MTPAELHAEVLAALTAAGHAVADSTAGPWRVGDLPGLRLAFGLYGGQGRRAVAEELSRQDAHLAAALRNTAAAAYAGTRRIVERHAPTPSGRCSTCWGRRRADLVWPCPDYRDAAAVLPRLPEAVADALHQ